MNKNVRMIFLVASVFLAGCESMKKLDGFMEALVMPASSSTLRRANNVINYDFVGEWVTTYQQNGETRGSRYKLTSSNDQFNANLTTYLIKRGTYSPNGTQPVIWSTSSDRKKIHTKIYDEDKTVFWGLTWRVDKFDDTSGLLEVTQTIDGMKSKGSTIVLHKCGLSSSSTSVYKNLCML